MLHVLVDRPNLRLTASKAAQPEGPLMATYEISVLRVTDDSGKLTFTVDGTDQFTTDCWWDPDNAIPAKTYTDCSTTLMASKGYKSVYLPDEQTGKKGIFVHPGTKPEHSDGCIVI